jgi:hypothetical protein
MSAEGAPRTNLRQTPPILLYFTYNLFAGRMVPLLALRVFSLRRGRLPFALTFRWRPFSAGCHHHNIPNRFFFPFVVTEFFVRRVVSYPLPRSEGCV